MDCEERLICVKEAARELSVSVRTVWRMLADGQLRRVTIRGCTRLLISDVRALSGEKNTETRV